MAKTIVAIYDDLDAAQHVVSDLMSANIDKQNINLIANDISGNYDHFARNPMAKEHVGAAEGSVFGGAVGALTGMLIGLSSLIIPGVGPIIVAGPVAAALAGGLAGAAVGTATGGIAGGLLAMDIPEDDVQVYAEAVRRGSVLVTATVPEDQVEAIEDVMRRHNPIDVDRRVTLWRESGWTHFNPAARTYTIDEISQERESYQRYDAEAPTQPTRSGINRVHSYDQVDRSARV